MRRETSGGERKDEKTRRPGGERTEKGVKEKGERTERKGREREGKRWNTVSLGGDGGLGVDWWGLQYRDICRYVTLISVDSSRSSRN